MEKLFEAIILSWGWRRRLIALLAGALSAFAQPPFFLFPLLWVSLPVLVLLLDGAVSVRVKGLGGRLLSSFGAGWWFGFGYFLAGLWWIGAAFLVEADEFAWLMPFAVVLLPAGLAIFWGFGAAFAQLLWSTSPWRIFALAAGIGGAEWLRGHLFTGFPWNAIGYTLTAGDVMMQSASLANVYALGFLAVVIFAAPASLVRIGGRNSLLPSLLAVALFLGLAGYGLARLGLSRDNPVNSLHIRIVQPAIDQAQKWLPENKEAVFERYLSMSQEEVDGQGLTEGTLLVWPETALPFALTEEPGALTAIADILPANARLVTGAARAEDGPDGRFVFNSVYIVDDSGTIVAAYDKVHLVPFGEYLPLQGVLERLGLEQLTRVRGGFTPGPRRRTLLLENGPPFVPLICYEIIFPGEVLAGDGTRPGFLLNVTNDAWFGRTPGPYQHLHQARVRAVEEGLPIVRSANTGISAVIDSYGRLLKRGPLGDKAVLDGTLPQAIDAPAAARLGSTAALIHLLICFFVAFVAKGAAKRLPPIDSAQSRAERVP
ncbi:apolipoprotein N-acyltransferase [Afifella sp. IM 167]|uniref:apolipoprotein N-acyltransferase n=1 Tax=Afifella sp. IM 167 TaxID=2033586 RepID=UPI001CC9FEE8|nr:apolipoprotein N-acyltransferase [Afifella sp. IM 167]MBZ8133649.1 apolipoprotein N-acyltransferase [Afifella sp. IM 167]